MSQTDFLRELIGDVHSTLLDAGMASLGEYRPRTGPVQTDVRVFVRPLPVVENGDQARNASIGVELAIVREDVPDPEVGARMIVEGVEYKLEAPNYIDDATSRWDAIRV